MDDADQYQEDGSNEYMDDADQYQDGNNEFMDDADQYQVNESMET
jgi:hypothetical protein